MNIKMRNKENLFLRWLNIRMEKVREARRAYDDKQYDENIIKEIFELTNLEFEELVAKNFYNKYLISELANWFYISINKMNAMLEDGTNYKIYRHGKLVTERIKNHIYVHDEEELSLWKMEEDDKYVWNINRNFENRLIKARIEFLENKFGGSFVETLKYKKKKVRYEEKEAEEWEFLDFIIERRLYSS